MRFRCSECECIVERGVRYSACASPCCCSHLPVAGG